METITTSNIYAVGLPLIATLIALEALYSAYHKRHFYDLNDTVGTLGLLAGNVVMSLLIQGTVLVLYFSIYQFRVFTINDLMPIWAVLLLTLVMIDFVFYWYHRSAHRVRFLWAIHMNHHSSVEMNFFVAFRQAWFGPISKTPFYIVMPLLGFDPSITVVVALFSRLWGVFGHTQWIDKLGWLDGIFNTPSTHRVHHGTNPEYVDSNYGNLLIVWDRMFGTFAEEDREVIYGIRNNVKTFNPIKITFFEWLSFVNDLKYAKDFKEKLLCFLGKPEWKPSRIKDEI